MHITYKWGKKEILFFLGYFLLGLTNVVIGNSYLFGEKRLIICEIVQYISAVVFVTSFCIDKYKTKEFLIRLVTAAVIFLVTAKSHSIGFGLCALSIITSLNINVEKIIKNTIRNNLFFIVIVVIPALLGFIPNNVYMHNGIKAYSLGFAYYSNLPNIIFMITLAMYWLSKSKIKESLILLISFPVQVVIYKISTLRLTFYLYLLFLVVAVCAKFYNRKKRHRLMTIFSTVMFPVGCMGTFIMSFLYEKSRLIAKFNEVINYRLGFNYKGFMMYGLSLFGKKIEMVEEYWDANNINHYFYIDSGYVFSFLSYGIIFFCLLIAMYTFLSRYAIKNNQIKLAVWCLMICIYSVINDVMFNTALNPLPMIAFNLMWNSWSGKKKRGKLEWEQRSITAR